MDTKNSSDNPTPVTEPGYWVSTTYQVPAERIKDLLCSALEGGSNYWCESVDRMGGITHVQAPYRQDVPFVEGGWLEVKVYEDDGKGQVFRLDLNTIKKGLQTFLTLYPQHFHDFLSESDDATTADVFFQCCLFGEIIYG
jgi:hypothetical protein